MAETVSRRARTTPDPIQWLGPQAIRSPRRQTGLFTGYAGQAALPCVVTEPKTTDSVFLRVGGVLQQIRPAIQADGGDVELVEVTDAGVVRVRFHGACIGCPSATMTLKTGIEHSLREHVPEVTSVEAVEA